MRETKLEKKSVEPGQLRAGLCRGAVSLLALSGCTFFGLRYAMVMPARRRASDPGGNGRNLHASRCRRLHYWRSDPTGPPLGAFAPMLPVAAGRSAGGYITLLSCPQGQSPRPFRPAARHVLIVLDVSPSMRPKDIPVPTRSEPDEAHSS
jgi:hypothetical protein